MESFLVEAARTIATSALNDWLVYALRNVPGLPPIVQTIHIVSIAAVIASSVFICLRVLGLALPGQHLREMSRRLMPWTYSALFFLLLSGGVFVIARPMRYFSNPVFGWKMALLVGAVATTLLLVKQIKTHNPPHESSSPPGFIMKFLALVSLSQWIVIVLAGRWIAYSDYLFPPT